MANTFSLSDAKNDAGEWTMSPEQIRAEMADVEPEYYDCCGGYRCVCDYDEEED